MDALQRLLDERAIERMIIDYAGLNDAGDWHAVAAMYVADGRMTRPAAPDAFIKGRDAILAAFHARPPRTTRHIVGNIRVTIEEANAARAESQILLFTAAGAPPLVGSYSDRLVRTADGWRFVERRGRLDFPAE